MKQNLNPETLTPSGMERFKTDVRALTNTHILTHANSVLHSLQRIWAAVTPSPLDTGQTPALASQGVTAPIHRAFWVAVTGLALVTQFGRVAIVTRFTPVQEKGEKLKPPE